MFDPGTDLPDTIIGLADGLFIADRIDDALGDIRHMDGRLGDAIATVVEGQLAQATSIEQTIVPEVSVHMAVHVSRSEEGRIGKLFANGLLAGIL